MSRPIQLRFAHDAVFDGKPVLLDARLAENTTIEDLRAMMGRSRLVAEEMEEPKRAPPPRKPKAKPKDPED